VIGVYAIHNLVTGRVYVGSSVHIPRRWREHLSVLSRGVHTNAALQADWLHYGSSSFSWGIVAECPSRAAAIIAEQQHIDSTPDLYNAARRAGSGPRDGFRHTDASKRKMAEAQRGRPKSASHRLKLGDAKRGKPCPAQAAALRGRRHSPEHCEKIRISHVGLTHTEATKAHMREIMTGRVITWADKISMTKTGQPWSAARRAAFVASQSVEREG